MRPEAEGFIRLLGDALGRIRINTASNKSYQSSPLKNAESSPSSEVGGRRSKISLVGGGAAMGGWGGRLGRGGYTESRSSLRKK